VYTPPPARAAAGHLRSLCVHVPTADDRMVENIQDMSKYEKLLHHFTVNRILNDIYLQWK
jgi:hypothetical protein